MIRTSIHPPVTPGRRFSLNRYCGLARGGAPDSVGADFGASATALRSSGEILRPTENFAGVRRGGSGRRPPGTGANAPRYPPYVTCGFWCSPHRVIILKEAVVRIHVILEVGDTVKRMEVRADGDHDPLANFEDANQEMNGLVRLGRGVFRVQNVAGVVVVDENDEA